MVVMSLPSWTRTVPLVEGRERAHITQQHGGGSALTAQHGGKHMARDSAADVTCGRVNEHGGLGVLYLSKKDFYFPVTQRLLVDF